MIDSSPLLNPSGARNVPVRISARLTPAPNQINALSNIDVLFSVIHLPSPAYSGNSSFSRGNYAMKIEKNTPGSPAPGLLTDSESSVSLS
jgi:hypothetical protein